MRNFYRFLIMLSISVLLFSCAERRKQPLEPPPPPPPVIGGEPPTNVPQPETPTPPPEPPSQPAPPQPAPQPKPRQPAVGDSASTKMVQSGVKQMNSGNLDQAEQMFEQALRVSPTNGKPYYYLGVLAAKQKDYERSLGFLEQAETYLKDDDFWMSQIFLQEGLSLKALGRKDEARSRFQQSLQRDPSNNAAQAQLKQ